MRDTTRRLMEAAGIEHALREGVRESIGTVLSAICEVAEAAFTDAVIGQIVAEADEQVGLTRRMFEVAATVIDAIITDADMEAIQAFFTSDAGRRWAMVNVAIQAALRGSEEQWNERLSEALNAAIERHL